MGNPFDLTGRRALVTGGATGIGEGIALGLAAAGADVALTYRSHEPDDTLAKIKALGVKGVAVKADFSGMDKAAAEDVVSFASDALGGLDILVNNAGMSPLYDKLTNVTEALYEKILQVNLRGPFRLSTLVGERMAAGDGGSIIMVSSTAAVQPTPTELPYGMAKAGINAFTLGLARAYSPKVRVNCIMPGPFLTDIAKAWDMDAFNERARTTIPLGRGGQAEEIVGAALYFASDASSFTTGAILKIDGGSAYPAA